MMYVWKKEDREDSMTASLANKEIGTQNVINHFPTWDVSDILKYVYSVFCTYESRVYFICKVF